MGVLAAGMGNGGARCGQGQGSSTTASNKLL